jgi:hypothetical protein
MTLEVVNKRHLYDLLVGPMVTDSDVHKDHSILVQGLLSPP